MAENGEFLKHAMRNWASSVAVVTSSCLNAKAGTSISSFTSLSLDPPLVLINLAKDNPTQTMIEQSGYFGISILSQVQKKIADVFAGFGQRIQDRFAGLDTFSLVSSSPLITEGLAHLDCKVYDVYRLPKSVVFIGEVIGGHAETQGSPLIYFNRAYVDIVQPES